MSSFHIKGIEDQLYHHGWIVERLDGNDLDISEIWHISRHHNNLFLIFDGMGDLNVLPIEKSYGCHLKGNPSLGLYFTRNNKKEWKKKLLEFIKNLDL
jgi:hypothetical protein